MNLPPIRRLLVAFVLAGSSVAHADPADDARRHFRAALTAAQAGDYQYAVDEFLAAYGAIPHAATAFNLGRAYEDMGDPDNALFWYGRFQEMDASRATEADEPIRRVRAVIADRERARSPEEAQARLDELDAQRAELVRDLRAMGVEVETVTSSTTDTATPTPEPAAPGPAAPPADGSREAFITDAYEQVVVTASRYSQDPLDSPSSITVLTSDDIRMSGAVHIADVLRRVVSVDVMSMSAGVPYMGVRGFNSEMTNKVLWLIDGRPTSLEFLATPMPVTMPITLEEIDRIEIIRGPGSAIYGANAVTGVVNIITKRPGEGDRAMATFSGGLNSYLRAATMASGSMGRVGYRLSAGFQQEGRFEKEVDEIDLDGPVEGFRLDQNIGDRRLQAAARFDTTFADKGWASLSGGYGQGFTEFYSKAALGNFAIDGKMGHIRGDVSYGPFHFRSYWMREAGVTEPWLFSRGAARSTGAHVRDDVVNLEAEGTFDIESETLTHRFHVGAGYTYKQFRAGVFDVGFQVPRIEHHAAAFAQYQLGWEWLQMIASFRLDKHPLIDLTKTLSPRGAFVFRVAPKTSLRASAGTSFRAMNGLESYVNLELNTSADGYYVNFFGAATDPRGISLVPERITTVELGARDESSNIHTVDAALYWNRVTDLIDIGSVEPRIAYVNEATNGYPFGRSGWVNDSDTVYDAFGGELDVTLFPIDGLDIFANLALERIFRGTPEGREIDGSTAFVHTNAGVLYRSPVRLDVSVSGHYTSKQTWRIPTFDDRGAVVLENREIPGRFLLSARIAGRPILRPELELAVTLWNPLGFGKGFREHPDGQIVGPRLFGSATVSF